MSPKNTICDFWAKTAVGGHDDCWQWLGAKNSSGYGNFAYGGKVLLAHRFIFEQIYGPLRPSDGFHGQCVCHSCDNPACVSPKHLFAGSGQANRDDCTNKQRHSFGGRHGRAALTEADVLKIRQTAGTNQEVADAFGVSPSTISYVRNRKTWRYTTLTKEELTK